MTEPAAPKTVQRIQQNLLATYERRLLNWLCARLPAWVSPDGMTALGFFGALLIAAGFVLSNWGAAWLFLSIAGLFINWFGDSLDGSLARFRKIERPNYGYFVDHSIDSLANGIFITAMGISPYMRVDVALFALVGYLLLSIHTFIAAKVMGEFRLSYVGGGPTELRIMLIGLALAMYMTGPDVVAWRDFSPFDLFAMTIASILVLLFIGQTLRTGRFLFKQGK